MENEDRGITLTGGNKVSKLIVMNERMREDYIGVGVNHDEEIVSDLNERNVKDDRRKVTKKVDGTKELMGKEPRTVMKKKEQEHLKSFKTGMNERQK